MLTQQTLNFMFIYTYFLRICIRIDFAEWITRLGNIQDKFIQNKFIQDKFWINRHTSWSLCFFFLSFYSYVNLSLNVGNLNTNISHFVLFGRPVYRNLERPSTVSIKLVWKNFVELFFQKIFQLGFPTSVSSNLFLKTEYISYILLSKEMVETKTVEYIWAHNPIRLLK